MPRAPRVHSLDALDDELVLLIPEAAKALRTSTDTVRRMIHEGALDAVKLRGQWRIPRAALDAYVGNGKPTKPAAKRKSSKTTKRATARKRGA
jgi:excisionase family DNA binding protein